MNLICNFLNHIIDGQHSFTCRVPFIINLVIIVYRIQSCTCFCNSTYTYQFRKLLYEILKSLPQLVSRI